MLQITILALAALLTSIISAIIGMGGGILLLAVMIGFLPHAETIPAHGAVQLVSNSVRMFVFIKHVDWGAIGRFLIGAIPGSALGGYALWALQDHVTDAEPYLKIAIGVYVLAMTFKSKRPRSSGDPRVSSDSTDTSMGERSRRLAGGFTFFGFLAGMLGLAIGAIGPLIAPLFLHFDYVKERLIATKAICQATIHVLKIPVFLISGLVDYAKLSQIILIMSIMVIPGTLIGKRILRHVNEQVFVLLFRIAMLLAGLKVLAYDGIYQLFAAS